MDDTTNPKFDVKWNIKIGDIVKIMRYDADAYGTPAYGTVIKKEETNQIYMFPAVEVLLFDTKEKKVFPAGLVEVVSCA
jgi:hypothetical protein|tara:strand:- start:1117 stop:1353 length:237 start_codon:yes stop_codon:yes gene_type:complete